MKSKRIIAIILTMIISFTMIINNVVYTKAVVAEILAALAVVVDCTIATENSQSYNDWYENTYKVKWRDAMSELANNRGFIPQILNDAPWLGPDPIQSIKDWMEYHNGTPASNITDAQAKEQLYNMWSNNVIDSSNNTFMIGGDLNNYLQYCINNYIDETGFRYVYTYNVINYATSFSSGDKYVATRDFISDLQNNNSIYVYNNTFDYGWSVNMYNSAFVRLSEQQTDYTVQVYDLTSWDLVPGDEYQYSDGTYNLVQVSENGMLQANVKKDSKSITSMPIWGFYSSGRNNVYKMYMSIADLKADSVGQSPYYINNSVYNDWSSSSGDYTVSTDNSNTVSYGDITNYIDSFNTEYGRYPSDTDIFHWIENYNPSINPTPTPTPNGSSGGNATSSATANNEGINITINNNHNINFGGSSLSGNTVSGNGVDGSGGNIFDFIGRLGSILGNLIKNLGNALVDLITGISETISSILSGLTNIFTGIIEFTFAGLPEDIRALLLLGLSVGLIVSVVKILRG